MNSLESKIQTEAGKTEIKKPVKKIVKKKLNVVKK